MKTMIAARRLSQTGSASARASKAAKKSKKRCKKNAAQCAAAVREYCAPQGDPQECEGVFLPCCERFTSCNVEPGIACIYETFLSPF
jgi:hypothetical protein